MPGTLFVVATPIGNLDDVSARALRVLRDVALIAAEDTRRTAHLLARYGIPTATTSLHEHNEYRKAASLIERLKAGDSVALVSDAGTPTVSDPGRGLVKAAVEAGITVQPIPGPSAVMTALAVSGFPADRFLFLGFPPTRSKDRKEWLRRLAGSLETVVFFEAPHRIRRTLAEIMAECGDMSVLVAREVTKVHEELVRGPISEVVGRLKDPRGEYVCVIDIGHKTETVLPEPPSPADLADELGRITSAKGRRAAVATLAKRHGLSANQVYELLEAAKTADRPGG